ncbi:MAG: hypothetical protein GOV02_03795 [Candidatus Aenigmarchaeota archaeon]|nr:hypothetical protein [Candidatus Aenigmarchaeota archaeon]
MRSSEEILNDICYELADGVHTFSMCTCGRKGCRGSKCILCLRDEVNKQ